MNLKCFIWEVLFHRFFLSWLHFPNIFPRLYEFSLPDTNKMGKRKKAVDTGRVTSSEWEKGSNIDKKTSRTNIYQLMARGSGMTGLSWSRCKQNHNLQIVSKSPLFIYYMKKIALFDTCIWWVDKLGKAEVRLYGV